MWSSYKCTSHSVQLIDTYWVKVLVTQSCLTLCYPMDYSPPGSSVHGDSSRNNTRVVAMPSSKGTSPPRDETQVSHMAGRFFTFWATTEGKEPSCPCRKCKRRGFDLWFGLIPWRKKWQSAPVFLSGEFHGQRSLVSYSPYGGKELNTTEWLSTQSHYSFQITRPLD